MVDHILFFLSNLFFLFPLNLDFFLLFHIFKDYPSGGSVAAASDDFFMVSSSQSRQMISLMMMILIFV